MEDGVPRTYEFTPLGVFIADRPAVVRKKILSITANDRMTLFDVPMPVPEELGISYPTTLGELFRKMGDHLQVPYRTETFMNGTLVIPEEPKTFCGATMRDVLDLWDLKTGPTRALAFGCSCSARRVLAYLLTRS